MPTVANRGKTACRRQIDVGTGATIASAVVSITPRAYVVTPNSSAHRVEIIEKVQYGPGTGLYGE
jgi:hypothetical protein